MALNYALRDQPAALVRRVARRAGLAPCLEREAVMANEERKRELRFLRPDKQEVGQQIAALTEGAEKETTADAREKITRPNRASGKAA